jgi:hypothetical protein
VTTTTSPPEAARRSESPAPSTRTLRRAEKRKSFFAGLVAEHSWSKLTALLFAIVVVKLIDRELVVELFDGDLPLRVVAASDAGARQRGGELLLVTEDGVAVHRLGDERVRVTIRGRRKLAEYFGREEGFVGRAVVRRAWLVEQRYTSRHVEGSDFDFGVPVDDVRLEKDVQVDFSKEVVGTLRLEAAFTDVPPGYKASAAFQPPEIRVYGAEAWLSGPGAIVRAVVPLDCRGSSTPFTVSELPAPEEFRTRFLRQAPGPRPRVSVTFVAAEDVPLRVDGVPLVFVGAPGNDLEFQPLPPLDAKKPVVTVRLRGPKDQVQKWESEAARDELRRRLQAQIDADALSRAAAPYLSEPSPNPWSDTAPIEVLRVPEGLRVESADQKVEVLVKKRST